MAPKTDGVFNTSNTSPLLTKSAKVHLHLMASLNSRSNLSILTKHPPHRQAHYLRNQFCLNLNEPKQSPPHEEILKKISFKSFLLSPLPEILC